MIVAIIGSRGLTVSALENYLPDGITEIVSGGAKGVDECAKKLCSENRASIHGVFAGISKI